MHTRYAAIICNLSAQGRAHFVFRNGPRVRDGSGRLPGRCARGKLIRGKVIFCTRSVSESHRYAGCNYDKSRRGNIRTLFTRFQLLPDVVRFLVVY